LLGLLLFPVRLFFKLLSMLMLVIVLGALAGGAYLAYNYLRPASHAAVENLARGTVTVRSETGEGTGAVIATGTSWTVVTAAHVVGASTSVEVVGRDGTKQVGRVQTADVQRDVALISVQPGATWSALPVSRQLPSPGKKVSTRCFFDDATRQGLYAGPVDDIRVGKEHIVQFDLAELIAPLKTLGTVSGETVLALIPVEKGCSGAPLLNQAGEIVGIILAGNDRSAIAVSSASALP